MLIAAVLQNFAELPVVQHAFAGIRVVVSVLIFNAVAGMWKKSVKDRLGLLLVAAAFIASVWFDVTPVAIVVAAAVLGIVVSLQREGAGK
jgi:chromate transporter